MERGDAVQALAVALQHPLVSAEPRNVCSLAQVCRSWRTTVQQSAAGATQITLDCRKPTGTPYTSMMLEPLAVWLPKHAGLVRDLTVMGPPDSLEGELAVSETLLAHSLRLAKYPRAAATAEATEEEIGPFLPALQLQRYSSNLLYSPAVLAALPAATLTHLDIRCSQSRVPPHAAFAAALGALTNLRSLSLVGATHASIPGCWLAQLAAMPGLTSLQLDKVEKQCDCKLLPATLQQLSLSFDTSPQPTATANLQHLSNLQQLSFQRGESLQQNMPHMPLSLIALELDTDAEVPVFSSWLGSLQQLQLLTVNDCSSDAMQLQQLPALLPQLRELALQHTSTRSAVNAAPAWRHLPQLSSLSLTLIPATNSLPPVLHGLSAATSLTKLGIWLRPTGGEFRLCRSLSRLTRLRQLHVFPAPVATFCSELAEDDAMHLSTLTGLTSLELRGCGKAVTDTTAVALACALTRLQVLDLSFCLLSSTAAMPVIGRLTKLRSLNLTGNLGFTDSSLLMLTGLTGLTQLAQYTLDNFVKGYITLMHADPVRTLEASAGPCQAAYQRFWVALRRAQHRQQK